MWLCKNPQKKCTVIQNGRQNKGVIITYLTLPIVMGYKENKTCCGGKKGGVAKVKSSKSGMK